MLTFNAILRHEGIDSAIVQLVRHQDTRYPGRPTPYILWRSNDGRFDTYQGIQRLERFRLGGLLASFVVTPQGETIFAGLYSVDGVGPAPEPTIDPVSGQDMTGCNLYQTRPDPRLSEYVGLLVIDWGLGFRSWVQRADRQDKPVREIRREINEPPFPGFAQFRWDIDEIEALPLSWQEVLRSVKGIYLLVCKETGRQYVGSAKGEESLLGRFLDYARTGHGRNVELKRRGRKPYQVTVLEIANSGLGIEQIEETWKRKLMSREFGLNE
jgi:hypothetical protein